MVPRRRTVLIGLALAAVVYLGLTFWYHRHRATLIGLTDHPCTADDRSITGNDFDDWGALCFYRETNARLLAAGKRPKVVMIGDSLTMGWPDQGEALVNRGIGQQSSSQVLLRFTQDAVRLKPRFVHILVGTNDVAGTTGPVTTEQLADNLLAMIAIANAHDVAVILGTIPPARDFGGGDPRAAIARANEQIRMTAMSTPGVVLADYHAVLSKPDGTLREDLFLDGVHPSAVGYAAMQPVFKRALDTSQAMHPPRPQN